MLFLKQTVVKAGHYALSTELTAKFITLTVLKPTQNALRKISVLSQSKDKSSEQSSMYFMIHRLSLWQLKRLMTCCTGFSSERNETGLWNFGHKTFSERLLGRIVNIYLCNYLFMEAINNCDCMASNSMLTAEWWTEDQPGWKWLCLNFRHYQNTAESKWGKRWQTLVRKTWTREVVCDNEQIIKEKESETRKLPEHKGCGNYCQETDMEM